MSDVRFTGLNSGLNTDKIINNLVKLEARPIKNFQEQIKSQQTDKGAFKDLKNRASGLLDQVSNLSDPSSFKLKTSSSSDSSKISTTIENQENATPGTSEVFVEQLATSSKVTSGKFVNDQKMFGTSADGNAASSISSFEQVSGAGTLDTSSDFLDALSKNVTTQGSGTNDFKINGTEFDLDSFSSFDELENAIENNTSNLDFEYDKNRDKFFLVPTDQNGAGGSDFTVEDINGSNFFQQIGIAEDNSQQTFDTRQSVGTDVDGDGNADPQSFLNVNPSDSFAGNDSFTSSLNSSGTIQINNTSIDYDSSSSTSDVSSIDELVQAVNDNVEGVSASYNETTDKFQLETSTTGAGEIDVSDTNGGNLADVLNIRTESAASAGQVQADDPNGDGNPGKEGTDAVLKIDGTTVTSSDNTVSFNGMSLAVDKTHPDNGQDPIEITVGKDEKGITKNVQKFVDQFNSVMDLINSKTQDKSGTSSDDDGESGETGPLIDDSSVQLFERKLRNIMISRFDEATEDTSIQNLESVGLEFNAPTTTSAEDEGKLKFDKAKFKNALEDSPIEVREFFTAESGDAERGGNQDGMAVQMKGFLEGATGSDGIFSSRLDGIDTRIERLQEQIDSKTERVQRKKKRLQREFRAMEQTMLEFQNQSSFLSSKLGGGGGLGGAAGALLGSSASSGG